MKKLMMLALAAIFTVNFAVAQQQQGQGQRPQQREQMTAEKRAEMLQEQLDLSDAQVADYIKFEESREEVERGDREAMQKAMEEQTAFMKELLTEEQYAKYEEMQQNRRQQGQEQRQQGQGQRQQRQQ